MKEKEGLLHQKSEVIKIPESSSMKERNPQEDGTNDSAIGTESHSPSLINAHQSPRTMDHTTSLSILSASDELKAKDKDRSDVGGDPDNKRTEKEHDSRAETTSPGQDSDKLNAADNVDEKSNQAELLKDYKGLDDSDNDIGLDKVDKDKKMVLFFLTPAKQVVSIRNVQNGSSVSELKAKLETLTGLPAYTYCFGSSKYVYKENTALVLGRNVSVGAVIRLLLHPEWLGIYRAVQNNDLDTLCRDGGVALFGKGIVGETEEELTEQFQRRLFTALFLAAFKNERKLCDVLIGLGADVKYRTDFDNTVLHVVAGQNHMPLVDYFLKKGAELMIHNRDGKTAIHIAQDIGSTSCERYMRLYNWTLTGKKHFPDIETISEMESRKETPHFSRDYSKQFDHERSRVNSSDTRRCKSAPSRKITSARAQSKSKFHSDCSRTVEFVTRHNVPEELQYTTTIDYVKEPNAGQRDLEQSTSTEGVSRKHVPYIDLAKSEENKMVVDQKRRVKSAVVRAQHTPVYYNWYKDRQHFDADTRYVRCKSSKSTSDLDELRRQRNEAAFRAWVRKKENEGAFDIVDGDDENQKTKLYTDEENERAFTEWLEGKKELLEQMGKRNTPNPDKFKLKRERVQAVVEIGENEPGNYKADPSMYHTAYHRWMRQRQEDRLSDQCQLMSVDELKRLIEAKRKRTVLNAKAYEEWLEEKREENMLLRKMRGKANETSPRPTTFQKWLGMTATGEAVDTYKSSKRPYSSVTPNRMHAHSMNSAPIPMRTQQVNTNHDTYGGHVRDSWKDCTSEKSSENDNKAFRAVRFEPVPRGFSTVV